jgi:GNAT superfamily N-acetyltransferase
MAEIVIREVVTREELGAARELMQAYGVYLAANPAGAASICLQGYEQELEGLPGVYAAPSGVVLVAWVDGAAAGCVAVKPLNAIGSATGERGCELKRLWVGSGFRGHRLGRRLMEEAMEWARRAGNEAMYLDTVPTAMPEANALYAALGFERVERYNDNPVADVVFFRRGL